MERSHRLLIYLGLLPLGGMALLAGSPNWRELLSTLGVGLVCFGIVGILADCWLARNWMSESRSAIFASVRDALNLYNGGLQRVTDRRRNNPIYFEWADKIEAACRFDMWGVSVFHRVKDAFKDYRHQDAVELIVAKVRDGWRIRALFVDPRAEDAITQLSEREARTPHRILVHLEGSVRFCDELFSRLSGIELDHGALEIRVTGLLPCEAYHRLDDDLIIGFYPPGGSGADEPAYRAVGKPTIKSHQDSFDRAFGAAQNGWLLRLLPNEGQIERNDGVFDSIYDWLRKHNATTVPKTA